MDTEAAEGSVDLPPIFVVNLDRSTERWHQISNQLNSLSLPCKRFSAIEGAKLSKFDYGFNTQRFRIFSQHELVPGEAGCSYSHIEIWRRVVKEELRYAVVLEDDVQIKPGLVSLLKQQRYLSFDYLKLDVDPDTYAYPYTKISEEHHNGVSLIECDPIPFGTGGYIISNKGAQIFLKASKNMFYPIDILPQFTHPYTKQGVTIPNMVAHVEEESVIVGRDYLSMNFIGKIQVFFYKLFSQFSLRKAAVLIKRLTK